MIIPVCGITVQSGVWSSSINSHINLVTNASAAVIDSCMDAKIAAVLVKLSVAVTDSLIEQRAV